MKNVILRSILLSNLLVVLNLSLYSQSLFTEVPLNKQDMKAIAIDKTDKLKTNPVFSDILRVKMNDLKKTQKDGRFPIGIGKNKTTAVAKYVKYEDDNNYEWIGEIIDEYENQTGRITLLMNNGNLSGSYIVDDTQYLVQDYGENDKKEGKYVYLVKFNNEEVAKHQCSLEESAVKTDSLVKNDLNVQPRTCNRNVRVLFLYTQNVINSGLDPDNYAANVIADANQTFRNSGITVAQLNYQYAGIGLSNVNDNPFISNESNATDRAIRVLNDLAMEQNLPNSLRNQTAADLVLLIKRSDLCDNNGACISGRAFLGQNENPDFGYAFADINFPIAIGVHELGHLFGCKHQNDNATAHNLKSYARGWTNPSTGQGRTIMFTPVDNNTTTLRFYNPDLNFGDADRNNTRRLLEIGHLMANYKQGQDPLQVFINGPSVIDNTYINYTWCASSCNNDASITNYAWSWSGDGFNYSWLGGNSTCASRSGYNFWTSGTTIFIKLIATYSTGQQLTVVKPVQFIKYGYRQSDTSTPDNISSNIVKIWPNPSVDQVSIEFKSSKEKMISASLTDIHGMKIKDIINVSIPKGKYIFEEDLSTLQSGIYYIIIDDGQKIETLPLIITK
ncbi:MAG: hypothetical protein RIR48_3568 [Bacteroidota bacterium]|jgi:hypothetical protein